jgi:hypothetical protein
MTSKTCACRAIGLRFREWTHTHGTPTCTTNQNLVTFYADHKFIFLRRATLDSVALSCGKVSNNSLTVAHGEKMMHMMV